MIKLNAALGTILLGTSLMAFDITGSVGVMGVSGTSPYQGVGSQGAIAPTFELKSGDFFMRTGEVRYSVFSMGYDLLKGDAATLSVIINPLGGYRVKRSDLSSGYQNIDDRKYQFEAGLKYGYATGWNDVHLGVYALGGEHGNQVGGSVFRPFRVTENLSIIPRAYITYFDKDYVDYYFGVSKSEADRNSAISKEYNPDGGVTSGLDIAINYNLSDAWSIIGFAGVENLSSDMTNSPIVQRDYIYRTGLGAKYNF
ncbi:MipA/OmpV family protein [uncultured Cetobacterium sp.]|uniref:MipA/OmpV family protein n=1 Tax=uncultured Cetobacterium sp. TaxID=527638 RepID=UPI002622419F|nr:MipA/OmpV family protein [uncultured Cetobacterium sp.]